MTGNQTTIRAYGDWRALYAEARAGGVGDIAQFIADNTADPRADDPIRPIHFTEGYIEKVRTWVEKQR